MSYSVEAVGHKALPSRVERLIAIPAPGLWGIKGRIRAAWGRHRTQRSLKSLEDRLLVDIGLNRDQITQLRAGRMPELPVKRRD